MMKAARVWFEERNVVIMSVVAGEMIVDARGLLFVLVHCTQELVVVDTMVTHDNMVMRDTMPMAVIFSDVGQFVGFMGSSGPSQSTMFGSIRFLSASETSEVLLSAD